MQKRFFLSLAGIIIFLFSLALAVTVESAPRIKPPPNAPTSLNAITISSSQINLAWTDNSNDEAGFKIERRLGLNGTYIQIATVGANVTTYSNTSLTANTTYYYRVRAYNKSGDSNYSNEAGATTLPMPPAVPSGLGASAISSSQINLAWTDNSNDEAGFKIERKTGISGTYSQITTAGADVTAYPDTGLAAGATYYYRVRAYNSSGDSAYSNEANATTLTAAPTVTTDPATNVNGSSATLNATVNPNGSATTVYFEWGTSTNYDNTTAPQPIGSGTGNVAVSAFISGLSPSTTYYYRVVATNANGTVYGDDVSFTAEADTDGDGIIDINDNCPFTSNSNQDDGDGDGTGDVCDNCTDTDGDGYGNPGYSANTCQTDNCPIISNPDQLDEDGDSLGNACDNCPTYSNVDQTDSNGDGIGDICTTHHCVTNSSEFQQALSIAESNNMYDIIMLEQGIYNISGNNNYWFDFISNEIYGIAIEGGYINGCIKREVDPENTILDGNSSNMVLQISYSPQIQKLFANNIKIDGLTVSNGFERGALINFSATKGELNLSNNIIKDNHTYELTQNDQPPYGCGLFISSGIYNEDIKIVLKNNKFINNTFSNYYYYPWAGGLYIKIYDGDIVLTGNIISGNKARWYGGAYINTQNGDIILKDNTIKDNTATYLDNSYYTYIGGLSIGASDILLVNNIIVGNMASSQYGGAYAVAISATLINNTITGNTGTYNVGGIYISCSNGNIYNNIIWNNTGGTYGDMQLLYGFSYIYNNDFDPSKVELGSNVVEGNNVNVNPLFVDSANGDFHLSQNSPLRDIGDNSAPSLPDTDFEGEPRINGGVVDIGADEYTPVTASFTATPAQGSAPLTVNFADNSSSIKGTIVSWQWDFNYDGTIDSTLQNPAVVYAAIGKYTVSLTVTDSNGYTDIEIKTDYIEVKNPVTASFTALPTQGVAPLTVNFTDTSSSTTGTIVSRAWDFDNDGVVDSTEQNPAFTYNSIGTYSVSLTIKDSNNFTDTMTKSNFITIGNDYDGDGIIDSFDNCPTTYNPDQLDFDNDGIGYACDPAVDWLSKAILSTELSTETAPESYAIYTRDDTNMLKDGILNTYSGVSIVQKSQGKYDVLSLQSNVDATRLSNIILNGYVQTLDRNTPQAAHVYAYNADGNTVNSSMILNFTLQLGWNQIDVAPLLSRMNGFGFVKFRIVATQKLFSISEAYFTPTLAGETNRPPVAVHNGSYSGIINTPLNFRSNGSYDPDGDAITYYWDFGDGNNSALANPSHIYTSLGTYTVTLTLTDSKGATGHNQTTAVIVDDREIEVIPSALDFGSLGINTSKSIDFTVRNNGTGNLLIGTIAGAIAPFSVISDGCSGQTLPVSTSCIATVKFAPTAEGTFMDMLTIPSNDTETPNITVGLSGAASLPPATLTGTVTDKFTGLPLSGVTVTVIDSRDTYSTTTDSGGIYTVSDLTHGSFTATFEKTGYVKQIENGTLISDQTLILNIQLTVITITITSPDDGSILNSSPITVTGDLNYTVNPGGDREALAQSFKPTTSGSLNMVSLALYKVGNPNDNLYIKITTQPGDTPIAVSNPVSALSVPSQSTWVNFYFSAPQAVTADTTYNIELWREKRDTSNYILWKAVTGVIGPDPGGWTDYYTDGALYSRDNGYWSAAPSDFTFMIYINSVLNVSQTSINREWKINGFDPYPVSVTVNGIQASVSNNTFSASVPLNEGLNTITATASDLYNHIASDSITVTLVAAKGAILGTVTDSSTGLPIPSATVSVTDSLNNTLTALTGSDGKYIIAGIAIGAFSGSISKDSYTTYNFSNTVSPGQTITINAALSPILPTISNITVSNLTANSATVAWSTDQASDSKVEYGITTSYGSSVSDSTLATSHSLTLTDLSSNTTYHFKVTSKNTYGFSSSSGDNTFTTLAPPSQITIAITSPLNGATISRPDVMVKGAVTNSTGNETGVTVNGIVATVYGTQFIANHVLLVEGSNTITATAIDVAGNTATTSITINAVTTGNYIRLTSNIDSGIAPLEVTLRIDGSFSIDESSISVTGPAQPEIEFINPDEYSVRMITEGIYYFTVSVTGPDGIVYQDTIAIIVLNQTELDNLLKGKWEGMKGALIIRDIEKAISYFSDSSKDEYREIFQILDEQLPALATAMREITLSEAMVNVIEYYIKRFQRGVDISYFIYFIRDENGIWRINGF